MPVDATSALRGRHRRLAELTAAPGARVLDLGCGDGATLVDLAGRVGADGWLLGIDRNPRALAAAAAMPPGPPRWLLVRGDLAKPLPIATGSVDRVLCHNTLEALADPAGLLVEAHRVLRPGGQAVIGHSDFDTLVFAGADLALTRRLGFTLAQGAAAMAAKSGLFTTEEPDAWLASLQTASARGDYLFSVNDYIVVAAKEPNSMRDPQMWD